ncbi:hypothetical protein B0T18DRAFT_214381 [Schizothecium vesticola]|uniref:Secreted protein n=1 Tax=Schizothecium vesticola TaxID=314040 RepID=A0AA40EK43_9PEZI|nr:hypothetical protein B0T18DRAFT_214381 [Schizothecium vesticola]
MSRSRHVFAVLRSWPFSLLFSPRYQLVCADHSRETIVPSWMPRQVEDIGSKRRVLSSRPVPAEFPSLILVVPSGMDGCQSRLHPPTPSRSQNTTQGSPVFALCGSPKALADCGHFQCQGRFSQGLHTSSCPVPVRLRRYEGLLSILSHPWFRILNSPKPGFV